jgi:tetratricopeptide (TPR) repeat protein
LLDPRDPDLLIFRGRLWQLAAKVEKALADFDAAIRLDPGLADSHAEKAAIFVEKQEFDKALEEYQAAVRLDPERSEYYIQRGHCRLLKQQPDQALADLNQAIRLDAENPDAFYHRAVVLSRRNLPGQALEDLTEAIRVNPQHLPSLYERGRIHLLKQAFDDAIGDFSAVIKLASKDSLIYYFRGVAWQGKRAYRQALDDYDESIRLLSESPWAPAAHAARAWIRATCPEAALRDGAKAVESATKACKQTEWQDANCLITLAAAYAESGDFEAAIKWAERAIVLLPADHPAIRRWRESVEHYKLKQPHRETL